MNATKVARKLRDRIGRFSGDLSKGLCAPARRFVSEMVYGVQASQSVMLTEVGRTLEEDIALRKTEWRLSRNLQRPELEDTVQENLLAMAAKRLFGVPDFKYYALADGLRSLFTRHPGRPVTRSKARENPQMTLFAFQHP